MLFRSLQGTVRDDITLMDNMALSETLTTDFASAICSVNNFPGSCHIVIGSGTNLRKAASLADILFKLYNAGIEADDDAIESLSAMIGLLLRRADKTALTPQAMAFSQLISKAYRNQ